MSYATIEMKIHDLLSNALDDSVSCTRGFHQPNELSSAAVRPGRAERQQQGPQGRLSTWVVEVALKISSGLSLTEFHSDCLEIRQTIVDTLDAYPTLELLAGVTGCMVTSMSEPVYTTSSGRTHTFEQVLYVEVKEVTTVTTGEYA